MVTSEQARIAGHEVTVSKPTTGDEPRAVTFILSALETDVSEYDYIRDMLVTQKGHTVIAMKIHLNNIMFFGVDHEKYATRVKEIFQVIESSSTRNISKYNIVGHSVGAKLALMLAAKLDPTKVDVVVAMDPVDTEPTPFHGPVFTNNDESKNLSLKTNADGASIHIMFAKDTTRGVPEPHNAEAIHTKNAAHLPKLVVHPDASHMAYAEQGGGLLGALAFGGGTTGGNKLARDDALRQTTDLIR